MVFNLASRIITNILFYDLESALKDSIGADHIAISPLMDFNIKSLHVNHSITITTATKNFSLLILTNNFSTDEDKILQKIFFKTSMNIKDFLQIILKKNFTTKYNHKGEIITFTSIFKEIDISVAHLDIEKYIELLIPVDFFRLFSKEINYDSSAEIIESELLKYFTNPRWMLPDLNTLLTTLSGIELNKLVNQLQRMNLLTTYQLYLITVAFPELSVKMKRVLSKNTITDVLNLKKTASSMKISKRDISGGIYSIEESIYFLIQKEADFSYSSFLINTQKIIKSALNMDLLLIKDFNSWIYEIKEKSFLYKTITITDDIELARAVSKDTEKYLKIFKNYISKGKFTEIKSMISENISYDKIVNARISFILNYRKLKMKKMNPCHESLEYLLVSFSKKSDYLFLLLSVGWFTLSTALKGMKKKNLNRILKSIPHAPCLLIEDVLRGVVNPNILHDEMQINKAKKMCVKSILQLYDDGFIELE